MPQNNTPSPLIALLAGSLVFALVFSPFFAYRLSAQTRDSIAFHLYTDSLKKGVHNYINVDELLDEKRWTPLSDKEISFSSTAGHFEGNSLFIEKEFNGEKVTITATLRRNPKKTIATTLYIKRVAD